MNKWSETKKLTKGDNLYILYQFVKSRNILEAENKVARSLTRWESKKETDWLEGRKDTGSREHRQLWSSFHDHILIFQMS